MPQRHEYEETLATSLLPLGFENAAPRFSYRAAGHCHQRHIGSEREARCGVVVAAGLHRDVTTELISNQLTQMTGLSSPKVSTWQYSAKGKGGLIQENLA